MKELNLEEKISVTGGNPILAYLVVRYVLQRAAVAATRGVVAGAIAYGKDAQ
ncbi:hypothetical protein ACMAZF_19105 [Psychrobium sp. nBUS_13]|uniref:hypothetical protein n=1 Tax=Psychrobium sp. nBUS_13 TaxID=3395319 RepID=UPI003EB76104